MHFYYICCHTRGHPKPTGSGAGAKMHLWVCLRAGFSQPRGFASGRVFVKPAPASAGAIPTSRTAAPGPAPVGNTLGGLSHAGIGTIVEDVR